MIGDQSALSDGRNIARLAGLAALSTVIVSAQQLYHQYQTSDGRIFATDYSIFRFASRLLWQGEIGTIFDPLRFIAAREAALQIPVDYSPFPYPPSALWIVAPLEFLPGLLGVLIWLGVPFVALAWLIARDTVRPWHAAAALLLAPAALNNIATGQNGFLSALFLCGGLLLLTSRPIVAGVLIGLLSFKPQLGILLPFVLLAGGHYRTFITASVMTVGIIVISLLLCGVEPWRIYFESGMPLHRTFLERGSGPAVLMNASVFNAGRLLGLPITLDYALQGLAALATIVACCWAFSRRSIDPVMKASVVMVGTFLVTPYCLTYDLVIVAAAQILMFTRMSGEARVPHWVHAAVWLLPLIMIPLNQIVPMGPPALGGLFWILLRQAAISERV